MAGKVDKRHLIVAMTGALWLWGCTDAASPLLQLPTLATPQIEHDAEGRCYVRDVTPAIIETVTEHVLVQPAQVASDGTVLSPAVFRTVTRQEIVRERREILFETVCPELMTPEFIASLQRALKTRGYYPGPITAMMDLRTAHALQTFQRQNGHDSPVLDIRTARDLGLVALSAEELGTAG